MWDYREVAKHNNRDSCWVIIKDQVYDVTDYVTEHPGGDEAILAWAGKDGTKTYEAIHPPGTIEKTLPLEKKLGTITRNRSEKTDKTHKESESESESRGDGARPLAHCLNLYDFERVAQSKLSQRAWIYYSSTSDDGRSFRINIDDWARVLFRPRVLTNVVRVDTTCSIFNQRSRLPIFIAPAAMARMGHPDGELCLVKGAARHKIGAQTEATIREARKLGFKALVVTVDTPVVGKREEDDRYRMQEGISGIATVAPEATFGGVDDGQNDEDIVVPRGPYSSTLHWKDLIWIRDAWGDTGPICLKGIATAEDAKLAAEAGFKSIYLSNHGGRQLDGSPSSLRVLLEIREHYPELLQECEILIDGGVRRGSDVVKALCLGARAVGLGRPFLYALSAYGAEGVMKAIQIIDDEIKLTMRLLGATRIDQLTPSMVNAEELRNRVTKDVCAPKARI